MSYQYKAGLGDAGSYQVSGKPWVTGSLDISTLADGGDPAFEIEFPTVTRWIIVSNRDSLQTDTVKVAFSPTGYKTNNFFTVTGRSGTGLYATDGQARLEVKITKLYLSGSSSKVDVIAGLTDINLSDLPQSWSGSAGVG